MGRWQGSWPGDDVTSLLWVLSELLCVTVWWPQNTEHRMCPSSRVFLREDLQTSAMMMRKLCPTLIRLICSKIHQFAHRPRHIILYTASKPNFSYFLVFDSWVHFSDLLFWWRESHWDEVKHFWLEQWNNAKPFWSVRFGFEVSAFTCVHVCVPVCM